MPIAPCNLFKNSLEFRPISDVSLVPPRTRGLYVLYHKDEDGRMNVVYIGMARGENSGVRARLGAHVRSKRKKDLWNHFSVYEVWDNIRKEQIEELEGLFRHLYRKDASANGLNVQRNYKPLAKIRRKSPDAWLR